MSYKTFTQSTVALVLSLLLSVGTAFAGSYMLAEGTKLPAYYPSSFQEAGTIARLSNSSMIISGMSYSLSMNVLIHSMSTEYSSRYELKTGKDAGFSFNTNANNKRIITEIWLLPAGSVLLP
jgi:hypothetical protein